MRYFVCLLDLQGRGVHDALRRRYEVLPRKIGLEFNWRLFAFSGSRGHAAVLSARDEEWGDPLVVKYGEHVGVGMVRLDNRMELERWGECRGEPLTDLDLVVRVVAAYGSRHIPKILGDFAFVVWSLKTREVIAATDAFALRRLYYRQQDGILRFASRAEALALEERYDVQHLAELVADCTLTPGRTVYANVCLMPHGTFAVTTGARITMQEYWTPQDFAHVEMRMSCKSDLALMCRDLLATSVRLRLSPGSHNWAQLSGGLDSSSIVSVAQWMAARGDIPEGLAGTVTYVDRCGTDSDERRYSEAVLAKWHVKNEMVVDPPLWFDDATHPPRMDLPGHPFLYHPREERQLRLIRNGEGRVLLAGFGGDELFTGTMLFFADWVAHGHLSRTMHELAHRAAIGRSSFWELMYGNAVLPLMPGMIRRLLFRNHYRLRSWISSSSIERYGLRKRGALAETFAGPIGYKYQHAMCRFVVDMCDHMNAGVLGDNLDVRYPYFYRPLVEFALSLAPELCVQPRARKWILREAMRGILPESVRTRIGKGGPTERLAWSLSTQRQLLEQLVRRPILAELGIVEADELRRAFDAAPHRGQSNDHLHSAVQSTLLIEAWLQTRSGRWPPERNPDSKT